MDDGTLLKVAVSALVPGTVVGILLLLAWWNTRGRAGVETSTTLVERTGEPFWVLPTAALFIAPILFIYISEAKAFPPVGAVNWLPLVAIAAGFAGLAMSAIRLPHLLKSALLASLLIASGLATSRVFITNTWSTPTTIATLISFVVIGFAMVASMERVLSRTRGFAGPAVLTIVLGGASQIFVLGFNGLLLALSVATLASMAGAAAAVALLRPRFSLAYGGAFLPLIVLATATLIAFISSPPGVSDSPASRRWIFAAAIVASAVLPAFVTLRPLSNLSGWKRTLVLLTLAGLPLVPAMAIIGYDKANEPVEEVIDYSLADDSGAGSL